MNNANCPTETLEKKKEKKKRRKRHTQEKLDPNATLVHVQPNKKKIFFCLCV